MKRLLSASLCLLLIACGDAEHEAAPPHSDDKTFGDVLLDSCEDTFDGVVGAVQEPFEDVGVMRDDIPEPLAKLVGNPYVVPPEPMCPAIQEELNMLYVLLGPDVDAPVSRREKTSSEETMDMAEKQAISQVRGQVQIVPFRGVVRRVSGADRHAKRIIRAYEAGKMRRAFLRGLAHGAQCSKEIGPQLPKKRSR